MLQPYSLALASSIQAAGGSFSCPVRTCRLATGSLMVDGRALSAPVRPVPVSSSPTCSFLCIFLGFLPFLTSSLLLPVQRETHVPGLWDAEFSYTR